MSKPSKIIGKNFFKNEGKKGGETTKKLYGINHYKNAGRLRWQKAKIKDKLDKSKATLDKGTGIC